MSIMIGDLQVQYSGGASNQSQAASLGGAISTAAGKRVISQDWTNPSTVTGVTILDAYANALGAGSLQWVQSSSFLGWKPFGGSTYDGFTITGDGTYTLGTASGYLVASVVQASLPGGNATDSITISNSVNKTFDNISAIESLNGRTEYRCFFIKNSHATDTAYDVRLWIKSNTSGPDDISIALDPNGKNANARGALVDEIDSTNVLSGITFTQPSSQGSGLTLGDLLAGDYYAFWIKRVITANNTTQMVNDLSSLGISSLI